MNVAKINVPMVGKYCFVCKKAWLRTCDLFKLSVAPIRTIVPFVDSHRHGAIDEVACDVGETWWYAVFGESFVD